MQEETRSRLRSILDRLTGPPGAAPVEPDDEPIAQIEEVSSLESSSELESIELPGPPGAVERPPQREGLALESIRKEPPRAAVTPTPDPAMAAAEPTPAEPPKVGTVRARLDQINWDRRPIPVEQPSADAGEAASALESVRARLGRINWDRRAAPLSPAAAPAASPGAEETEGEGVTPVGDFFADVTW